MPAEGALVGLISDCPLQRHLMQSAVSHLGFEVATNCSPERIDTEYLAQLPELAAWVVILSDEDLWEDQVDTLIEHSESPILFGLEAAPAKNSTDFAIWERRFHSKLIEIAGSPTQMGETPDGLTGLNTNNSNHDPDAVRTLPEVIRPGRPDDPVTRVVVLCASLGGPEAVKQFLDALPAGLPVSFIYAQHIDQEAASVLIRVLGRHANYPLVGAESATELKVGSVYMLPVEEEVDFDSRGAIHPKGNSWPGPYGPSIDQALLNVSSHFGANTHAIIFSGMGNDGAIAAPMLKAYGSKVWAQTANTCGNSSMVEAVVATGCVEFEGSPAELAEQLVKSIEFEELAKKGRRTSVTPGH